MAQSLRSALAWVLGMLGPAMLAAGTFLPVIRLREFEYTYSIVGATAILLYGIAVVVLTLNVVSVKLVNDVILQLHLVAMAVLGGCVVYGLKTCHEGADWFVSRLAYSAPSVKMANTDAYWAQLNQLTGGVNTMFGSLRKLYESFGPRTTYNDVELFSDTLNGLNTDQARSLIDAAGLPFSIMPVGMTFFVGALLAQVGTFFLLRGLKKAAV